MAHNIDANSVARGSTMGNRDGTRNLLDAFGSIDLETATFLLDSLEGAIEFEEFWEPLLQPFLVEEERTRDALALLAQDPLVALQRARKSLEERRSGRRHDSLDLSSIIADNSHPCGDECGTWTNKISPLECFRTPHRTTMEEGAHNRAISLRQLRLVVAYIEEHANSDGFLPWTDWNKNSPTYGLKLHMDTVNLYHVVEWLIKPLTQAFQCSLVEILSQSKVQQPRWFVSHVWCEPVQDFLASIEAHARVRGLSEDDFWWVCGYANNQHSIDEDINIDPDPRKTSFYRAMQQCEGVLLCLDSMATPFTRIWCCFEEAMIVNDGEKTLLLDISTVVNTKTADRKAVVLTDGLVDSDLDNGPKFALESKRERESDFPLALLEKGYNIDICKASASYKPDIRRILNAIAGVQAQDLGGRDPDLSHPSFEKTNQALRGIFAEAAARKAAEVGRLRLLLEVLREDVNRKTLTLNLGGCNELDLAPLSNLARHPNLERIILDCAYCSISNLSWIDGALTKLPQLLELSLNFSGGSNIDALAFAHLAKISSLKKLRIDLSYTDIPDLTGIGRGLSSLSGLRVLRLFFVCCVKLNDVAPLSDGLASLTELQDLKLNFQYCDVAVSLPGLCQLRQLRKLLIDYSYTSTKSSCLDFIKYQVNLQELVLLFEGCRHLNHLAHFSNIGTFKFLKELTLNFAYTNVENASGIQNLYQAPRLTQAHLNFAKCSRLMDVAWLPQAVSRVSELRVDLSECRALPKELQRLFHNFDELTAAFPAGYLVSAEEVCVGEQVKVFSPEEKRWLPAEIKEVDADDKSTRVEILRSNGLGQQLKIYKSKQRERIRKLAQYDAKHG